jgi:hypothetical protein
MSQACPFGSVGRTGYRSGDYADSLKHIGAPVWMPRSECWALSREIEGTHYRDLAGTYPLIQPNSIESLLEDLSELGDRYVSFVGVLDPMAHYSDSAPSVITPFKPHYVAHLPTLMQRGPSSTAVRNTQFAKNLVQVGSLSPQTFYEDFSVLYSQLRERHGDLGFADFDSYAIRKQLNTPGAVCYRVVRKDQIVGGCMFYVKDSTAYYHLSAQNDAGYASCAAYAMMDFALYDLNANGVQWVHLGSGSSASGIDGLSQFKRRWSTESRTSHLVKMTMNNEAYRTLSGQRTTGFFPTYRAPLGAAA